MYTFRYKRQRHASSESNKIEITWPHLAELARQSTIISKNVQSNEMENNIQNNHDFVDDTVPQSASFYVDPAYTETILSQQSFNSKVLKHYQYETSSVTSTTMSYRPYVPPHTTDSSPRAVKRSTAHTDPPAKSKRKCADGTETSNSWQAEKIEDSVPYKTRVKKLWKQAQESPIKFKAVV